MLKTSHISASATRPSSRTSSNTAGAGSGSEISKPTSACRRSRFSSPPPVMCARPRTGGAGAQQLEHRAHVDRVGSSSASATRRAAQRLRPVVERRGRRRRAARGAPASSRWSAGPVEGSPISASPGAQAAPVTIAVQRDGAEAGGGEVEAVRRRVAADQLRQHRDLAAGDLHARGLGARLQADADRPHDLGVGALDGQVVEHGDRLGADADDVVDVHRDAVDPDGVVAAGLLRDDQLRADAVGADGDAEVGRDLQHRGVVARAQHRARRPARCRSS